MAANKVELMKQVEKAQAEVDFYRRENGNLMRSGRLAMSPAPEDDRHRTENKDPNQPSPYIQNFVKSSFKPASLNDSLDKLQREFLQNYNEAMGEAPRISGQSGFKISLQTGGDLKEENELLHNQVRQMKTDMTFLVDRVRDELQTPK